MKPQTPTLSLTKKSRDSKNKQNNNMRNAFISKDNKRGDNHRDKKLELSKKGSNMTEYKINRRKKKSLYIKLDNLDFKDISNQQKNPESQNFARKSNSCSNKIRVNQGILLPESKYIISPSRNPSFFTEYVENSTTRKKKMYSNNLKREKSLQKDIFYKIGDQIQRDRSLDFEIDSNNDVKAVFYTDGPFNLQNHKYSNHNIKRKQKNNLQKAKPKNNRSLTTDKSNYPNIHPSKQKMNSKDSDIYQLRLLTSAYQKGEKLLESNTLKKRDNQDQNSFDERKLLVNELMNYNKKIIDKTFEFSKVDHSSFSNKYTNSSLFNRNRNSTPNIKYYSNTSSQVQDNLPNCKTSQINKSTLQYSGMMMSPKLSSSKKRVAIHKRKSSNISHIRRDSQLGISKSTILKNRQNVQMRNSNLQELHLANDNIAEFLIPKPNTKSGIEDKNDSSYYRLPKTVQELADAIRDSEIPIFQESYFDNIKDQIKTVVDKKYLVFNDEEGCRFKSVQTLLNNYSQVKESKLIKFDFSKRMKAPKNRSELTKVKKWLVRNLSSITKGNQTSKPNNSKVSTDIKENEDTQIKKSKKTKDLLPIQELFDNSFHNSFYHKHLLISYALIELKSNLQSSCKETSQLLELIYSEFMKLFDSSGHFFIQLVSKLGHLHDQDLKVHQENYDHQLKFHQKQKQLLHQQVDKLNTNLQTQIRSGERLKQKLSSQYYKFQNIENELNFRGDLIETYIKERSILYDTFKELKGEISDDDLSDFQIVKKTKVKVNKISSVSEHYKEVYQQKDLQKESIAAQCKLKKGKNERLDAIQEYEHEMNEEGHFLVVLKDKSIQSNLMELNKYKMPSIGVQADYKDVKKLAKKLKGINSMNQFNKTDIINEQDTITYRKFTPTLVQTRGLNTSNNSKDGYLKYEPINEEKLKKENVLQRQNSSIMDFELANIGERDSYSSKSLTEITDAESLEQSIISAVSLDLEDSEQEDATSESEGNQIYRNEILLYDHHMSSSIVNTLINSLKKEIVGSGVSINFDMESSTKEIEESKLKIIQVQKFLLKLSSKPETPAKNKRKESFHSPRRGRSPKLKNQKKSLASKTKEDEISHLLLSEIIQEFNSIKTENTDLRKTIYKMNRILKTSIDENQKYLGLKDLNLSNSPKNNKSPKNQRSQPLTSIVYLQQNFDKKSSNFKNLESEQGSEIQSKIKINSKLIPSKQFNQPHRRQALKTNMSIAALKAVENQFCSQIKTATILYNKFRDSYIRTNFELSKLKASSLQATIKKVNQIYSSFFSKVENKQAKPSLSLYIFVYQYFSEKYSKKSHCTKNYKQLFRSLIKYQSHPQIYLFGRFMGLYDPLDETCFTLYYECVEYLTNFKNCNIFRTIETVSIPTQFMIETLQHIMVNTRNMENSKLEELKQKVKSLEVEKQIGQSLFNIDIVKAFNTILDFYTSNRDSSEEVFLAADINQDGSLSYEEFLRIIRLIENQFYNKYRKRIPKIFRQFARVEETGHQMALNLQQFCSLSNTHSLFNKDIISRFLDLTRRKGMIFSVEELEVNWEETKERLTKLQAFVLSQTPRTKKRCRFLVSISCKIGSFSQRGKKIQVDLDELQYFRE